MHGFGRTVPFTVPMSWKASSQANVKIPNQRLKLNDSELKKGYKLKQIYAQSYIPLYVVFDSKTNRYVYTFDDRYVDFKEIDGKRVAYINLFELKIGNGESTSETVDKSLYQIDNQYA